MMNASNKIIEKSNYVPDAWVVTNSVHGEDILLRKEDIANLLRLVSKDTHTVLFEMSPSEARDLAYVYLGHSGGTTPETEALGARLLAAVRQVENI